MHVGKDLARQIANVVFIPFGILLTLAPPHGAIAQITRSHEPLLSAAGFTFGIWSVLFAAQLVYAVWQALPKERSRPTLRRIGWLTALNGLLQGLWTLAFTQDAITLSWVILVTTLATLALVERRLRDDARRGAPLWIVRVPYGLNLGWISVATILETSLFLYDVVGWRGAPLGPFVWSEVIVGLAALLAVAMAIVRRNLAFVVAVAWGLVGIGAYRLSSTPALAWLSFGLAALLVALVVVEAIGLRLHWRPVERVTAWGASRALASR